MHTRHESLYPRESPVVCSIPTVGTAVPWWNGISREATKKGTKTAAKKRRATLRRQRSTPSARSPPTIRKSGADWYKSAYADGARQAHRHSLPRRPVLEELRANVLRSTVAPFVSGAISNTKGGRHRRHRSDDPSQEMSAVHL